MYEYIEKFKKLGFGLFVHFGLYSVVGKGEWYLHLNPKADKEKYNNLVNRFNVKKTWAKELVKTAKAAGCKYHAHNSPSRRIFALRYPRA